MRFDEIRSIRWEVRISVAAATIRDKPYSRMTIIAKRESRHTTHARSAQKHHQICHNNFFCSHRQFLHISNYAYARHSHTRVALHRTRTPSNAYHLSLAQIKRLNRKQFSTFNDNEYYLRSCAIALPISIHPSLSPSFSLRPIISSSLSLSTFIAELETNK